MSKITRIGRNFSDMNSGSKKLRELFPGLHVTEASFNCKKKDFKGKQNYKNQTWIEFRAARTVLDKLQLFQFKLIPEAPHIVYVI